MLKVNAKTGEIFLHGVVGPEDMGGDFDQFDVMNAIEEIGSKRIKARINSPGGHYDTGIAIYRALKEHPGGVDTVNDSLAASIASVIMLAGEKRITPDGSRWMIHRARAGIAQMVTAKSLRDLLATMDAYDSDMLGLYSQYMEGTTPEKISAMLDAETWIRADESVSIGLSTAKEGVSTARPKMAAWFEHPPADFIAACATDDIAVVKSFPVLRQAAKLMV